MGVEPEFEAVLAEAQAGADWAFSLLYRTYHPRILRYLSAHAHGDAEDLAAETWMGAARLIRAFEGGEPAFRSWLFTIAHHRLAQHWRLRRRRPSTPTMPELLTAEAAVDDPEATVVADLSARDAVRRIAELLTPEQADVLLLRVVGGLDTEAVAAVVGKRPGAVRVIQHRALRRLAQTAVLSEEVTG